MDTKNIVTDRVKERVKDHLKIFENKNENLSIWSLKKNLLKNIRLLALNLLFFKYFIKEKDWWNEKKTFMPKLNTKTLFNSIRKEE